ncbi:MAG: 4Fe-4S binding protein [Deltaproteobacteria bacterium]|nr:4Fe-4S binding protein [Deltaproteobacteria bacterium]
MARDSAARARQLVAYRITSDCKGCGVCRKQCPWDAILGAKKERHVIEPTLCEQCGTCWHVCPKRAIEDEDGQRREGKGKGKVPKAGIDRATCVGCQNCLLNCEQSAIEHHPRLLGGHCSVDQSRCVGCGSCLAYCASDSIELEPQG